MNYTYANRKRGKDTAPKKESTASQPSMDALRAGLAKPTQEQMGRRVDLPDAMRAKMENAFGADLSAVKLYESEAVADAGANAIAQGSNIAFAPGMLDFTSYGGQALLGHEISHVVSQQRGEVTGSGFLNDHALEARADREGAMAAAGQQIAMPTATMSSASAAPAAGPMQADKKANKIAKHQQRQADAYDQMIAARAAGKDYSSYEKAFNSAKKWEAYWAGGKENTTFNPLLAGNAQLDRAKSRNTGKDGKLDEDKYFREMHQIMLRMGDDRLKSDEEAGFRNRMVDEYSGYRGRQIASGDGGNAFIPVKKIGESNMLADLYGHMMGRGAIEDALNDDNEGGAKGVRNIAALADSSGVSDLMARQLTGAYGKDVSRENEGREMKNFWNYVVTYGGGPFVNQNASSTMRAFNELDSDQSSGEAYDVDSGALSQDEGANYGMDETLLAFQQHLSDSGRLKRRRH